jgi:hypothetical protein
VGFLLLRGQKIPSLAIFSQITETFKRGLRAWADEGKIPWLEFKKGERKDDVVDPYPRRFAGTAGVVLIGVAQERADGWTATKQVRDGRAHFTYRRQSVCVNQYYVYFLDPEWGPGFLKICGHAPYALKLCLNSHEWAKRQLAKQSIGTAGYSMPKTRSRAASTEYRRLKFLHECTFWRQAVVRHT